MVTQVAELVQMLSTLPETEQARIAQGFIDDLKWEELLNDPRAIPVLTQMAQEAKNEYYSGKTQDLAEVLDEIENDG